MICIVPKLKSKYCDRIDTKQITQYEIDSNTHLLGETAICTVVMFPILTFLFPNQGHTIITYRIEYLLFPMDCIDINFSVIISSDIYDRFNTSAGGVLVSISPREYHPPSSQCFGTDMVY